MAFSSAALKASASLNLLNATFDIPVTYLETTILGMPVPNGLSYNELLHLQWTYAPGNFAGGTGVLLGGLPAPFGAAPPLGTTVAVTVSSTGLNATLNGNYQDQTYDVTITFAAPLTGPNDLVTVSAGTFDVAPVTVNQVTGEVTGTASAGLATSGTDALQYIGGQTADWANALNWLDTSAGGTGAAAAPGLGNAVSIDGGVGTLSSTLTGPGNAASSGVTNQVSLGSGPFNLGAITIGTASVSGTLAVLTGAALSGSTLTIANGGLNAYGGGVSLSGLLTLAASPSGAASAVYANLGSVVQAASIVSTDGSIVIDSASRVEIGSTGGAGAGTLTVDPGASLTGTGAIGTATDNGLIAAGPDASGASLQVGYVSGSGQLQIGAGATLELLAGSAATVPIGFSDATGTLRLQSDSLAAGTISGFVPGDHITVSGAAPATDAVFAPAASGGMLTLLAGTTAIGALTLAGSYADQVFTVSPIAGGYDIGLAAASAPAFLYTDTTNNTSNTSAGQAYVGPVTGLQRQFLWSGNDDVAILAKAANVFLQGGGGADALAVTGGSNVLDGGQGSSFLVGGTGSDGGNDTFFVDGHGGGATWSTISNFHHGDAVTVWGFTPVSTRPWTAVDGAQGYQGATVHAELGGAGTGVNASITFAGISLLDVQSKFSISTGAVGDTAYLSLAYTG